MCPRNIIDQKLFELSTLFELSQLLNSSLDIDFILDNLLLVVMGRMMISKSIVFLRSDKKNSNQYVIKRQKGFHSAPFKESFLLIKKDFVQTENTDQISDPELRQFTQNYKLSHIFPMISNSKIIGYALFADKIGGKEYSPDDLNYLKSVVNIASASIDNAESFLKIKRLNTELDHRIFRLNTLFDISKQFNAAFEEGQIAKLLGFVLMSQLLVNRFFIFFRQEEKWNLLNSKGVNISVLIDLFYEKNMDQLREITYSAEHDAFRDYKEKLKIETIYPIIFQGEIKCIIGVGASLRPNQLEKNDEEFLSTLANYTINALENAYLFRQELSRKRMEEEMQMARNIQRQLLPEDWPIPEKYDIHAVNIPSFQVGGDLFDLIPLPDDRIITAIADVTGKGTPAALLMSNIQAALRTVADESIYLPDAMAKINNLICTNTSSDKFITCFVGILDPNENRFAYVNAGHNPPYLYRNATGKLELLEAGGLLLGIMPDVKYEQEELDIQPGDLLFLFTDGVSEALDEEGFEFGEAELEKLIVEYSGYQPELLIENILKRLENFRGTTAQSDDITIICIRKDED